MRFRRFLLPLVAMAIVAAATGSLAFAQTTGDITGTVTDSSGAALPGVTCTATSPSLQGSRTSVTSNSGNYRIASLPPGTYKVSCGLAGFATTERTAAVTLGATATVNQSLQISQREEIIVTGQAPVVDTTSTTTGSNYSAKVMEKMPLGRNYASVVKLQPGVQEDTGDRQGRGLALSVYGSTSAENQFVIDGISTNSVVRGVQAKFINQEFIQEVEVKTGGYQAEFGRATGGIINVITKSGGNEFHGDVFGSLTPSSLREDQVHEATDEFNQTFDDVQEVDYGADLGGFFIKDRLWFFTAYNRSDGERDHVPQEASSVLGQRFREDIIFNLFSGKLTFNIAQGSTLVGTYFRDPEHRDGAIFTPTGADPQSFAGRRDIGAEDYAGRFNQLFGSFGVLTLQYSHHNDRFQFKPLDATRVGIRDRTIDADFPNFPVLNGFGSIPGYQLNNTGERDEYGGSFTAYLGSHEFKLGGDWIDQATSDNTSFTGGTRISVRRCSSSPGSTSYCPPGEGTSYINYVGQTHRVFFEHQYYASCLGCFDKVDAAISAPPSQLWSAFLQDTWRITPRLSVNLGVRYDVQEVQNQQGEASINLDNMWQPRVGVVYDWKGDGSTKLYGSFGRFYYQLPNDLNVRNYGAQYSTSVYNYNPDPAALQNQGPGVPGPPNRIPFFQGAFNEPTDEGIEGQYQDEFTLGAEAALTPSFAVGIKGMYRKLGRAIEDRCDLDGSAAINQGSSCAIVNPGAGGIWGSGDFPWCDNAASEHTSPTSGQCFPSGAPAIPEADRTFKGVELTARKTFTQNLWAQASYIYSTLEGNYDGAVRVASGQTDPGINADYDYYQFSINSDGRLFLDRPHQLRLDAVYNAPFGLSVGFSTYYRSGPPVSRYGWFSPSYPNLLHLVPRGHDDTVSGGRLVGEYEANLSLGWTFKAGPVSITPTLAVFNLLDRQGVLQIREDFNGDGLFCEEAGGCDNTTINPDTGEPYLTDRNFERTGRLNFGDQLPDADWARPQLRQEPRSFRVGLKISF